MSIEEGEGGWGGFTSIIGLYELTNRTLPCYYNIPPFHTDINRKPAVPYACGVAPNPIIIATLPFRHSLSETGGNWGDW